MNIKNNKQVAESSKQKYFSKKVFLDVEIVSITRNIDWAI